jgi:acetylornithine deacetylase/succinyl-diaminopimelate desuccinylase-like protein
MTDDRATRGQAAIGAAWEERILPTLAAYTRIQCLSPAFDPEWAERGALMEAAQLLQAWTLEQDGGLRTEIVQLPERTPVLLVENGGTGDPILIYGHMDKQPPLGEWRSGLAPFEPVREGDLLYGRGTADDGYALFAAVTALVAAEGGRGRVVILIEASEESGSPDLSAYVEHLRDRIGTPSLVICLDSGCLSYDRLWLTSSLRGNLVANVRVDVLTEGVHSGVGGGVVPSSFRILRSILSRIEDESTGAIRLPELLGAGVRGQRAADRRRAAAYRRQRSRSADRAGVVGGPRGDRHGWRAGHARRRQRLAAVHHRKDLPAPAAGRRRPSGGRRVDLGHHHRHRSAPDHRPRRRGPRVAGPPARRGEHRRAQPVGFHGEGGTIPFLADLKRSFPHTQFVATGVLGPHSNAHGPNEFLHIPMAKAVTGAVAELLR